MKLSTHLVAQLLIVLGQIAVAWEQVIPEKYRVPFHLTLGGLQAIVGIVIAHNYNPDGTPAKDPYEPDAPKPGVFGRITKAVALAFLCASMFFVQACSPKQLATFKAVSAGMVATTTGIQTTLESLITQGKLTPEQAGFVRKYLTSGIALVAKIDTLVQAVKKWPPENAAAIVDLINQTVSLVDEATSEGIIKFGGDATMQRVGLTLAILKGALSTIKSLLGAAPVTGSRWQRFRGTIESPFIEARLRREAEKAQAQLEQIKTDLDAIAAE